jgi:hypothetical protein
MPFRRPSAENVVVHADGWDEGETVTLRPQLDFIEQYEAGRAALIWSLPEGVGEQDIRTLPEGQRQEILANAGNQARIQVAILHKMIVEWTLRYYPTDEQRAAGQPGDVIPITLDTIKDLGSETIAYLIERIEALGQDPAEGLDDKTFREGSAAPAEPEGVVLGAGERGDASNG